MGTYGSGENGKGTSEELTRPKVQIRSIGTEQPVVAMNPLKRWRSKGAALSRFEQMSTTNVGGANGQNKVVQNSQKECMGSLQESTRKSGAAGIDEVSIQEFEKNLKNNLYKIWNRMSSGSYFPPPVKEA